MKEKIKTNLEKLFNQNYELIKGSSFQDIVEKLIEKNPDAYYMDSSSIRSLFEDEDIAILEESKQNKRLVKLFESAKDELKVDNQMIERIKKDIIDSIEIIRNKVKTENKGLKNQIIFLEYDSDPYAYFCGFGEGEYPILETPKYVKFNYREELFNGIGKIGYAEFWNKRIMLDELLEELDLSDLIWSSEIYQGLQDAYKFKTNLLLYEAFERIPIETFVGIPIKFPLFIFGNEHDCEAMNVYLYE
ncbi:MAG: hypothetical protein JNK77_09190 [Saprospiraceae bacterium]|nr:hypothetical protein [Saprospiraceae bacterium]